MSASLFPSPALALSRAIERSIDILGRRRPAPLRRPAPPPDLSRVVVTHVATIPAPQFRRVMSARRTFFRQVDLENGIQIGRQRRDHRRILCPEFDPRQTHNRDLGGISRHRPSRRDMRIFFPEVI